MTKISFIQNPLEEGKVTTEFPTGGKLVDMALDFCDQHQEFPNLATAKVFIDVDGQPVEPNDWNDFIVPDGADVLLITAFGDQRVSGALSIVVGVVMIVAGWYTGVGTFAGIAMIAGGVASVVGGIMTMTAKTPNMNFGMSGAPDDLAANSPTFAWEEN